MRQFSFTPSARSVEDPPRPIETRSRPGAGGRLTVGRRTAAGALLLSSMVLAACHLLDQTDFEPKKPPPPPGPPPVPDPETRVALVTIDYVKANPDYATALSAAVKAVEAKRPGSLYDVVAVVGDAGAAPAARIHAAEVMTSIEAEGVIPARIQLGLRLDPGRKVSQVRIYLR